MNSRRSMWQELIDRKSKEGLSARTIAYMRGVLRAALSDAERWGLVFRNAAALAAVPHRIQTLTPTDARSFLAAAKKNHLGALFSVALAAGLRLGEARGVACAGSASLMNPRLS
ncbi:MAG: hypothetical protein ABL961_01825 [Vicinamibacterales bacterium]